MPIDSTLAWLLHLPVEGDKADQPVALQAAQVKGVAG